MKIAGVKFAVPAVVAATVTGSKFAEPALSMFDSRKLKALTETSTTSPAVTEVAAVGAFGSAVALTALCAAVHAFVVASEALTDAVSVTPTTAVAAAARNG